MFYLAVCKNKLYPTGRLSNLCTNNDPFNAKLRKYQINISKLKFLLFCRQQNQYLISPQRPEQHKTRCRDTASKNEVLIKEIFRVDMRNSCGATEHITRNVSRFETWMPTLSPRGTLHWVSISVYLQPRWSSNPKRRNTITRGNRKNWTFEHATWLCWIRAALTAWDLRDLLGPRKSGC